MREFISQVDRKSQRPARPRRTGALSRLCMFGQDEGGQYTAFIAISAMVLVMFMVTVYNVGVMTGEKMRLQNIADSAAYSEAVWEARVCNFIAYSNRAMVANLVLIAEFTALASHARYIKDAMDKLAPIISLIPYIGPALANGGKQAAQIYKQVAEGLARVTVQASQINNQVLTAAQQVFYFAMQAELLAGVIVGNVVRANDRNVQVNPLPWGGLFRFLNWNDFRGITRRGNWRALANAAWWSSPGFVRSRSWGPAIWTLGLYKRGSTRFRRTDITASDRLREWLPWPLPDITLFTGRARASEFGFRRYPRYLRFRGNANDLPSIYVYSRKRLSTMPFIRFPGLNIFNRTFFGDGRLHALARAEVYYRRPGNRNERANFFNPFWGARLAPADELLGRIGLGFLGSIITH